MRDQDLERQNRTQAIRFLLYPVLFAPDLSLEVDRVANLFRTHSHVDLMGVIRDAKAELSQPLLQIAHIERLVSNPTEDQVRTFLSAVLQRLEADPASQDGT